MCAILPHFPRIICHIYLLRSVSLPLDRPSWVRISAQSVSLPLVHTVETICLKRYSQAFIKTSCLTRYSQAFIKTSCLKRQSGGKLNMVCAIFTCCSIVGSVPAFGPPILGSNLSPGPHPQCDLRGGRAHC